MERSWWDRGKQRQEGRVRKMMLVWGVINLLQVEGREGTMVIMSEAQELIKDIDQIIDKAIQWWGGDGYEGMTIEEDDQRMEEEWVKADPFNGIWRYKDMLQGGFNYKEAEEKCEEKG